MAAVNYVFERVEKKYMMNTEQYKCLLEEMKPYMTADSYGMHTICNVYFDTDDFELIRRSLDKPVYKEKFRIRSYGVPKDEDKVFLEIKKKYKGTVFKRRVAMTLKEARDYLYDGNPPTKQGQIFKEIDYFLDFYKPQPKVYLAYDRVAYFGTYDPEIRITFDHNIRSRRDRLTLEDGDEGQLLLSKDQYLMEIKVPLSMPLWLSGLLAELKIYPASFSKYGNVYKEIVKENRREEQCLTV